MNAFDFIVTIALGSTLATVILNKSVTLVDGVLSFASLTFLQFLITYLSSRIKTINNLVKSTPTLISYKGELLEKNMKSERIVKDEVWAVLREKGVSSLKETNAVVLETDGTLTVIKHIQDPTAPAIKSLVDNLKN